jgi:hypothetical protein
MDSYHGNDYKKVFKKVTLTMSRQNNSKNSAANKPRNKEPEGFSVFGML